MKEKELRRRATCALCGKGVLSAGVQIFYTLRIECHGVRIDAIRRQDGLSAMLGGNPFLAAAMGPDEEMSELLGDPAELSMCLPCSTNCGRISCVAELIAAGWRKADR